MSSNFGIKIYLKRVKTRAFAERNETNREETTKVAKCWNYYTIRIRVVAFPKLSWSGKLGFPSLESRERTKFQNIFRTFIIRSNSRDVVCTRALLFQELDNSGAFLALLYW
ncbi:hypothetical protein M9H77_12349 [Catharanthus roseus]|uniref:Uncharacterized protein n=1 Tax=Catharanthus roseus TaxID=4058 RepID=A0ACC0BH78_CATRO|nr:hypothetical protein M9H77_12349 [Catharanthus roseus]